jgi:hypothetical protein
MALSPAGIHNQVLGMIIRASELDRGRFKACQGGRVVRVVRWGRRRWNRGLKAGKSRSEFSFLAPYMELPGN